MWSQHLQLFVFLAAGIYMGDRISTGDAVIFVLALVISSFFRKIILKKFFSFKTFVIFTSAAGIIMYHYAISDSIRPAYKFNDKYVTVVCKITDLPRHEKNYNIYFADVRTIEYLGEKFAVKERIKITSNDDFKFGDCIKVSGFLNTFPKKLNSRDFDSGRMYKTKGIHFKMYAAESEPAENNIKIYSPAYLSAKIKNAVSESIYKNYDGDTAAMLKAVLTGYKDGFSEKLEEQLYESNTMRMFYPSYMHISFIISLVGGLSAYVSKNKRNMLLVIMLALYAVFNINTHYIVKSALLMVALLYSQRKTGFSNYINMLAITAGSILITNPLIGYEAGFVLSVAANAIMFYCIPPIMEMIKLKNNKRKRFISTWIVLSVGMLPLQSYFFSTVTPYAFLLNFLYMPLLSAIWSCLPVSIILLPLGKFNIGMFAIKGLAYFMTIISGTVTKFPGYSISIPCPGILNIAIFYIILYYLRNRFYRRRKHDLPSQAALAVVIGFSITSIFGFSEKINNLEINFVNVGQGDGAVLSIPFRETIIIDGGGSSEFSDYDYGKEIFIPYLKREGHNTIDLAIVSHYHSDHCKGIIAAMKKLNVKEVLMPDCMENNEYRREIEYIAEEKDIKLSYFEAGTHMKFNSGMVLNIISPDANDLNSDNENDTSFGIRVDYGEFSALFTGDITEKTEKNHLGEWHECELVKVPHHGSASSSSEEFIQEISPETAVISVGENNSYGHPREEVISRYEKYGVEIYRTDLHGDITVSAKKNGNYKINTFLNE